MYNCVAIRIAETNEGDDFTQNGLSVEEYAMMFECLVELASDLAPTDAVKRDKLYRD